MLNTPRIALCLLIACACALPLVAYAGTVTGTVDILIVRQSDGLTYVYMNGTPSGKPACATKAYWIIQDENSEAGKKLYALLLAAKASNSEIKIGGAGTCTRWPDGEDIAWIQLL